MVFVLCFCFVCFFCVFYPTSPSVTYIATLERELTDGTVTKAVTGPMGPGLACLPLKHLLVDHHSGLMGGLLYHGGLLAVIARLGRLVVALSVVKVLHNEEPETVLSVTRQSRSNHTQTIYTCSVVRGK